MSVQLLIVLLYVALIVGIGVYTQKMTKSSAAFTGAGMGVLMIVAASCGEWLGGTSTTGVSEYGYTSGLSGSWYTIANGIGVLFLAIFFAKL
ncbi:MAG: sodium:solute symporter, partial [Moorella sp. (in: Bacteria)]|nr:sodium:solute symporter [Moorella sp. (in: firmicutes)]